MSAIVPINDTLPWTQEVASSGQTVFDTNWTADVESDILVYARADGSSADDATQLVSSSDYNITFIGSSQYVRVTFLVGRTEDDIITIMRATPAERLNLYINTNFTPSMLNGDFGRAVMMIQQRIKAQQDLSPRYNNSETLNIDAPLADIILPKLEATQIWRKSSDNTKIETASVPEFPVGSLGGEFQNNERLVRTAIATGENDIEEVGLTYTDSNVLLNISGSWTISSANNLNLTATNNLNFKGISFPSSGASAGLVLGLIDPTTMAWMAAPGAVTLPVTVNAIARFSDTTGGLKNSPVTIDDAGLFTGGTYNISTADRAMVTDADGNADVSDVTATELSYLEGATSNIQDQIDAITPTPGAIFKGSVKVATDADFASTYDNGTDGVGATLTADSNGAAELDGVMLSLNDRVLFTGQSDAFENGIYIVTQVGDGSNPAIYTRATDFDQPSEMTIGTAVIVREGDTHIESQWFLASNVTTIGTDAITFTLMNTYNILNIASRIQHKGDADNNISFDTNEQDFQTDGSSRLDINNNGVRLGGANSRVTTILDEDDMSSNSDTALATQQSIKEYVDSQVISAGGNVIQVVSGVNSDVETQAVSDGGVFYTIPNLEAEITKSETTMIRGQVHMTIAGSAANAQYLFRVYRDATQIWQGDAAGSRSRISAYMGANHTTGGVPYVTMVSFFFNDDPGAGTYTYTLQWGQTTLAGGSSTIYLNRSHADTNSAAWGRSISAIEVWETTV